MTLHFFDADKKASLDKPIIAVIPRQPELSMGNKVYAHFFKRVFEVALCLASAVFVLPVIAFLAILVAADGGKPFYSQKRIGRNGRIFHMWKLRSMVINADEYLKEYLEANPDARHEWLTKQKLKSDPRVTRVGAILRKTSMDELPQLWNVIRGDMSLVGPRPMMMEQKSMYPGAGYFKLRPGLTGLWQVSDRNNCQFHERAAYDDEYYSTLSFATDLSIMLRTVAVVVKGTGY